MEIRFMMRLSRAFKWIRCVTGVLVVSANVGLTKSASKPLPLREVGTQILNSNNEPHDVSWDIWLNGGQIPSDFAQVNPEENFVLAAIAAI